jgi:vitamin B12 transporter
VSCFKYALAALALLPTNSFAQTDDCDKDNSCIIIADPIRPDLIVVTANGSSTPLWEVGQAITVLTNQAIANRQSTSVADLLATTPGITVSRNGGPGQPTAVRIRGAEDAQTLVLIDGVRVNDPASPGGAFDFGNLLTGNIDRIEVLRGPNSVPWGSQAIGGVVNIVTSQLQGARLSAEYGYKNSKQIVGQVGGRFGPVTASIGGGYFDDDGISAFRGGTERDGYRQYAANARIAVEISDAVSIDLRGYFADSRVSFDGNQPVFPFARIDTAEFAKTQQVFGYAGVNVTTGPVKHRLAFTLSDTSRDSFDPAFGTAPNFIARGRTERFEYQGDATVSNAIRTVFGIEKETSCFRDDFSRYATGVTSGYVQAIVRPVDRLTLTGGLRVDDHKTYGTKVTASANAAWRIGSGTILRASYGEGFKAPTLFQLFSDFGNPGLKPETAQSFDAGLEQSLIGDTLKFGVTAFHRDTRNQIDFFSCFGSTNPLCATRPFGFYDNIARTRTQGIEAFVELRPTSNLTFAANYSLIDAKNRATGSALIRRPKHSVNVTVDWAVHDWLKLGASVQNVSDSVDGFGGAIRLDGYTLAVVRAAVPIGDHLEFYGRIENLFDASYETVSGYGTLGRNAHVGVRAKF